jgi:hypothetical protein
LLIITPIGNQTERLKAACLDRFIGRVLLELISAATQSEVKFSADRS